MSVTSISRDSSTNVSIVRMTVTDTLATVANTNYILGQQQNINVLNSGIWQWYITDTVLVSASNGNEFFEFTDATFTTLKAQTQGGTGTVASGLINQLAWYAANGTTVSGLPTANNGVLTTTSGGVPGIRTTLPSGLTIPGYQTSLTFPLTGAQGGTGIANTGLTINLGSATAGFVLTSDVSGNATWQATGSPTGQALTRTNDTNVTVTLGGTPSTSLLQATSLTLGWAGLLGLNRGGVNTDLSATGGVSQVLQQSSHGANITVGRLAASDLSDGTTGAGLIVLASFANISFANLTAPALGTPASGTLTNCTGLPISTGVSGLGAGIATFLATPSSANLLSAMTTSTGTGNLVFATSPTLVTPALGTPASGVLTNCTGLPVSGGGTGKSTFTAYSVICAGTTATGAFQNVSGLGTSGQVLTSNGAAALPTWQAAAGGGPWSSGTGSGSGFGGGASNPSNTSALAWGTSATAGNDFAIALGNFANASGLHSIAVGQSASCFSDISVAVGNNASTGSGFSNSTAVGNASTQSNSACAVGAGSNQAQTTLDNELALGSTVQVSHTVASTGNGHYFYIGTVSSRTLCARIDTSFNLINLKGTADQSYSLQTPSTGFSITIGAGVKTLLLNPSGTLATGTITMPASPIDGQEIRFSSSQIVTSLTVSANAGQSIKNAPTTITAGQGYAYIYNLSGTTWFRLY